MLSFANVFTKEIAMKLYAACDLCEVYVNTCVRIKTLKFSKAKSNNVIMKKIWMKRANKSAKTSPGDISKLLRAI